MTDNLLKSKPSALLKKDIMIMLESERKRNDSICRDRDQLRILLKEHMTQSNMPNPEIDALKRKMRRIAMAVETVFSCLFPGQDIDADSVFSVISAKETSDQNPTKAFLQHIYNLTN